MQGKDNANSEAEQDANGSNQQPFGDIKVNFSRTIKSAEDRADAKLIAHQRNRFLLINTVLISVVILLVYAFAGEAIINMVFSSEDTAR